VRILVRAIALIELAVSNTSRMYQKKHRENKRIFQRISGNNMGLLLTVDTLKMTLKMTFLLKLLWAQMAGKGSLTRMYAHMSVKLTLTAEGFVTQRALIATHLCFLP